MSIQEYRDRRAREQAAAENQRIRDEAEQADRRQREQWARENAEAKARLEAKLAAEEKARQDARDAETEQRLAPRKATEQRAWLAAHPDKTAADFDKLAWPLLRQNIVEAMQAEAKEQLKAKMRASGEYG